MQPAPCATFPSRIHTIASHDDRGVQSRQSEGLLALLGHSGCLTVTKIFPTARLVEAHRAKTAMLAVLLSVAILAMAGVTVEQAALLATADHVPARDTAWVPRA